MRSLIVLSLVIISCDDGASKLVVTDDLSKDNIIPKNLSDEDLIDYIRNNQSRINEIKLQELSNRVLYFQAFIHINLTPEKRYSLWKEKFEYLMMENLTKPEIVHLSKFKNALRLELFEGDNECLRLFQDFTNLWQAESIKFGWSEEFIRTILMSYSLHETDIIRTKPSINFSKRIEVGEIKKTPCNCSVFSTYWCDPDPCVVNSISRCEWSNPGCGTLLMWACDGYCRNS